MPMTAGVEPSGGEFNPLQLSTKPPRMGRGSLEEWFYNLPLAVKLIGGGVLAYFAFKYLKKRAT